MKYRFLVAICYLFTLTACAKTTLRTATENKFLMGVAVNVNQFTGQNPKEAAIINEQFSSIVPENCMKSGLIHPEENRFDFTDADRFVAFGEKNKQVIIGHCLIWHSQLPSWFFVDSLGKDVAPDVLKERMRMHITTIMHRYKGRIHGYDVVNEALNDDGSFRTSKFFQILGKDFIRLAFQYAHEADPEAELYYNDYSMEKPAKCDAAVQLVKDLKAAGCRVDGVGTQGHMSLDNPSIEEFETTLQKLSTLGVKIMVTEWDLSILPNPYKHSGANVSDRFKYTTELDPYRNGIPKNIQQEWNQKMMGMFALFIKYSDVIDRVTLWGLNDRDSWKNNFPVKGRKDSPVLFDRQNNPKPIVEEMIRMANQKY